MNRTLWLPLSVLFLEDSQYTNISRNLPKRSSITNDSNFLVKFQEKECGRLYHLSSSSSLNWSPLMIHVVWNQMKCILLNERPRDISLVQFRDQICHVYQMVNDVSVCYLHFSETKKHTLLFIQHITKSINQQNFHKVRLTGSAFLTNALLLRLNNNQSIRTARWIAHLIVFQIFHWWHSTRLN